MSQTAPDLNDTGEMPDDLHSRIAAYYTGTVTRFGSTPRGVDWTCQATQEMRFVQLLKLCDFTAAFSLNDLGCGYGALPSFIARRHPTAQVDYLGIDLSHAMIQRARRRFRGIPDRQFVTGRQPPRIADYTIASGVINVQLDIERPAWENLVAATLIAMRQCSRRGFAINFLAPDGPASGPPYPPRVTPGLVRPTQDATPHPGGFFPDVATTAAAPTGLYRTTPKPWVRFCQETFGWTAEIIAGYGMREFTLLARPGNSKTATLAAPKSTLAARTNSNRSPPARPTPPRSANPSTDTVQRAIATILSPEEHADEARVHAAWRVLRQEAPVCHVAVRGITPFWAITRYDDIVAVERKGSGFIAGPRTVLASDLVDTSMRQLSGRQQLLRPLTHMDEPDHGPYRAIAQPWFQPSTLASLEPWLRTWAKQCVDTITALNGTCDFAAQIAVPYTFRIITRIMGIREASEPQLDRLLRGLVGAEDPLRRLVDPPANPVHAALRGCRDYFEALATERRTCPRDDLASALANAKVNGDNLPSFESVSYYVLLAIAGYDTTAFALSGGLHALIQHPAQLARLRQDPSLLEAAVEEILRWTSPSRHFMRTATRDTELSGHTIRSGDSVAIFFPSANRDESLFKDPDSFQIDRTPNPHITFGWGPHYCLGQALARLELCALFAELLPRLHAAELAGPTRRAHSVFLTGFTSLPVALDVA